jgi:caa(3)-type oxidase subunit IV
MKRYLVTLLVLLLLTATSFTMAAFLPLGAAAVPVALAIAAVKVLLVASVFMHLSGAMFATRLVGLVTVLFVAILCLGIFADVALR